MENKTKSSGNNCAGDDSLIQALDALREIFEKKPCFIGSRGDIFQSPPWLPKDNKGGVAPEPPFAHDCS